MDRLVAVGISAATGLDMATVYKTRYLDLVSNVEHIERGFMADLM